MIYMVQIVLYPLIIILDSVGQVIMIQPWSKRKTSQKLVPGQLEYFPLKYAGCMFLNKQHIVSHSKLIH